MPSNPWLRLDLARLYDAQGLDIEAKEVMSPLYSQPRNGAQSLYAAALLLVIKMLGSKCKPFSIRSS